MLTWISSLFSKSEKKPRKRRHKLTDEQKRNLVTDKNINKMNITQLRFKYGVSESTVYKVLRDSRRF